MARRFRGTLAFVAAIAAGHALGASPDGAREPYASTYVPLPAEPLLITGATLLTGTGERLDGASVHVADGRIVAVGPDVEAPGARVVEARGQWLTPGLIDVHSHLGDYPAPSIQATADGNEATDPNTARVWAEHSVWPQDPQFPLALAGGVTTLQILPGSANLFGGRGVTLKNVPSRTVQGMKFPGAPHSLKMACGENPERVYGSRTLAPSTGMGNVAGYRAAWAKAVEYRDKRARAAADPEKDAPDRDLGLDTLVGVLDGEILVHNHCYRADEMAMMIDVAREFGYRITAFHHAVESYKIADLLAVEGICSAMWADWWSFKLEAFDAVNQNVALVDRAGACAIVHSDSPRGIQHLNQEAAKAMAAARRAGMAMSEAEAVRWLTLNAARALGVAAETGSIEPGKAADLVLWNRNPFSVYARAQRVYIDGYLYYDRNDPRRQPRTDFDLDQTARGSAP
ncbi:MAG: amidohydrolase [Pseudomonadales bacterium]